MLRITWHSNKAADRLTVEGDITGPESRVFWSECLKGLAGEGRFEIDLHGVTYLDNAAVDGLRELVRQGAEILDCSSFVWAMLHYEQTSSESVTLLSSGKPKRRSRKRGPEIL